MAIPRRKARLVVIRARPNVAAPDPVPSRPMAIFVKPRSQRARRRGFTLLSRGRFVAAAPVYEDVVFTFGELSSKWEFTMLTLRANAESRARVQIDVRADSDGLPYDPTSAIAEMAFMAGPLIEPGAGDWKACNWDVTRVGTYVMQCLVGPGGTVSLAKGGYYVWARLTDAASGEIPLRQVARFLVT